MDDFVRVASERQMRKLGQRTNELAAGEVSDFAKRQMKKMGWQEYGLFAAVPMAPDLTPWRAEEKDLGVRRMAGPPTSARRSAKRRRGCVACLARLGEPLTRTRLLQLGFAEEDHEQWGQEWWYDVYNKSSQQLGGHAGQSLSDVSDSSDSESSPAPPAASSSAAVTPGVPTDEELLRACGGRRCGMRARGSQSGKWKRTAAIDTASAWSAGPTSSSSPTPIQCATSSLPAASHRGGSHDGAGDSEVVGPEAEAVAAANGVERKEKKLKKKKRRKDKTTKAEAEGEEGVSGEGAGPGRDEAGSRKRRRESKGGVGNGEAQEGGGAEKMRRKSKKKEKKEKKAKRKSKGGGEE